MTSPIKRNSSAFGPLISAGPNEHRRSETRLWNRFQSRGFTTGVQAGQARSALFPSPFYLQAAFLSGLLDISYGLNAD